MIKVILDYIKLRPKTLVLLVALLVLTDIGINYFWKDYYSDPGKVRLTNSELSTIQNLKRHIDSSDGYKVLFLGDSQTYGSAVKLGTQTVPYYLESSLQKANPSVKIKVFNCAFKGFGVSENYFLLDYLLDSKVDLVIYNVSSGWLNRGTKIDHRELAKLSVSETGRNAAKELGLKSLGRKDRLNLWLETKLGDIWSLYGTKSALVNLLLGKPIHGFLDDQVLAVVNPKKLILQQKEENQLFVPWYQKDWTKQYQNKETQFGELNLVDTNPQLRIYKLLLTRISSAKVDAVFYVSPQNTKMLAQYHQLNQTSWQKGLSQLESITRNGGITYLDYSNYVDNRYFTDSVHMTQEGNSILAEKLAIDMKRLVEVKNK